MPEPKCANKDKILYSIQNKKWREHPYDFENINKIKQLTELPEIIARIISQRIADPFTIENYLNPKIKNLLTDPFRLKDMEMAVERTIKAIKAGEKIVIFGDYDVDGATSTALLKKFFDHLGVQSLCYIPDRITEGYGPSILAFDKFKAEGVSLVFTLDCGTMAFDAINHAGNLGLDVIVIDHHQSTTDLPSSLAVINPNRFDEKSEYKNLAACGVSFLFLVALSSRLKQYDPNISLPDLLYYLDLVALGTVCDVMQLTGLNRAFVKQGLKVMKAGFNEGIKALVEISGADKRVNTYLLGFLIGPRINAGGRVGLSYLGAKLLSTDNPSEAMEIAQELSKYNEQRKQIELAVLEEAYEKAHQSPHPVLIVAGDNWHQGVIGIIAGRLKDRFNKPTIVISLDQQQGKASSRSVAGFDIGTAVINAKENGIILQGGGHAMAAGFTIEKDKIDSLQNYLNALHNKYCEAIVSQSINCYSSSLLTSAINEEFLSQLELLEPFGMGNEEPRFLVKDCYISRLGRMGASGLSFNIDNMSGHYVRAKVFSSGDNRIVEEICSRVKSKFNFIGRIKRNDFYLTRKMEFVIEDIVC